MPKHEQATSPDVIPLTFTGQSSPISNHGTVPTPSPKKTGLASGLMRTKTSVRDDSSGGMDIFATFQSRSLSLKGRSKPTEDNDFTSMTGA